MEFPVDFSKYGTFAGVGTPNYKYTIDDRDGLAKAMGAGIYPSSFQDMLKDEKFKKWYRRMPKKINPWDYVNSGDPQVDYYVWAQARGIKPGNKLFFMADALVRAGHIELAIKAYHSLIINFPEEPAFSEDQSFVWYPAKKALGEITALTRQYPDMGWRLKGASVEIINDKDNDPKNDKAIVNPGEWEKFDHHQRYDLSKLKIVQTRGKGKVQLVQFEKQAMADARRGKTLFDPRLVVPSHKSWPGFV